MTRTTGYWDPSTAGPPVECGRCLPSRVDGRAPVYMDDPDGRAAHAAAMGHRPTPRAASDLVERVREVEANQR